MRARLQAALLDSEAQIASLTAQVEQVIAASQDSNADDEHDPEGATVAFERQQLVSLLQQARAGREAAVRALQQLDRGGYGTCERCGEAIGQARLEARPTARTCITCAR